AKNGAERVYVIAYVQDSSGTVVKGIEDKENSYVYTKVSSDLETMYLTTSESDPEAPTSEQVYVIYVKGDKKELGSTYELSLPEESRIVETIHKGDAGWRYKNDNDSCSYYDEEEGKYISDSYYYTDRVVVKAKNGAERVYVIAYVQDSSDSIVP
ncbi:MAG: hypothetical protein ACI4SQ_02945, partial [Eubacterium sp.]